MIWTAYLGWARLDPALYAALPLFERATVFRATVMTGIAVHYGQPARRWFRQRMPPAMLFRHLERVGRHSPGLAWYRAPDPRSAQYLADLQPDREREGHAILRQGEQLLLDARGHIWGWVVEDDDASYVIQHDGRGWNEVIVTPAVWRADGRG